MVNIQHVALNDMGTNREVVHVNWHKRWSCNNGHNLMYCKGLPQ